MSILDVNIADPAKGLCAYLATAVGGLLFQTSVTGEPRPAVFRPRLPEQADSFMPNAAIVVRPSGGPKLFTYGRMPIVDHKLDIVCYGKGGDQAYQVSLAVSRALRALTQSTWEGVLLYAASIAGGPIPLVDTQSLWPAYWMASQVMYAEVAEF